MAISRSSGAFVPGAFAALTAFVLLSAAAALTLLVAQARAPRGSIGDGGGRINDGRVSSTKGTNRTSDASAGAVAGTETGARVRAPLFALAPARSSASVPALAPAAWPEARPGEIVTIVEERTLPATLGATDIALYGIAGLDVDPRTGSVYLIDKARHMIFRVDAAENGRPGIVPFAGAQRAGFNGDGRAARDTLFHVPAALAVDRATGDVIVADTQNHRVRLISRAGDRVTTITGRGIDGLPDAALPTVFPAVEGFAVGHFSGDGGPAAHAELNMPSGVAVDAQGIVYIADSGNQRIRAVNRGARAITAFGVTIAAGAIETVAGSGAFGYGGDNGPARAARLTFPMDLRIDADGHLLIVDLFNHRIRRVDRRSAAIDTIAASTQAGGDPADAAARWRFSLIGLAVDGRGDVYYSDRAERAIYRLRRGEREPESLFTDWGFELGPGSLAIGKRGELLAADVYYNRLMRITEGRASVVAGGAPAAEGAGTTDVAFSILGPLAVDARGDLYLADAMHYAIRRLARATGRIETFMGTGWLGTSGDGGPAAKAELVHPTDVIIPQDGQVLVADQYGNVVWRADRDDAGAWRARQVAGGAEQMLWGEGEPATATRLGGPLALARHPVTGELYIACQETNTIRKIDRDGHLQTIAGAPTPAPAWAATSTPSSTSTSISTSASQPSIAASGTGAGVGTGTGTGTATVPVRTPTSSAMAEDDGLRWPASLAFDAGGTLYVSDMLHNRIRIVQPDGRLTTFAGTGARGFAGDGGPAAQAMLNYPGDLVFDREGNLYVSDTNNHRIRRIGAAPPHRIDTVVGNGVRGFSGDHGPAVAAQLNLPRGLAFGPDDVLYIVDSFNRRVRAARIAR